MGFGESWIKRDFQQIAAGPIAHGSAARPFFRPVDFMEIHCLGYRIAHEDGMAGTAEKSGEHIFHIFSHHIVRGVARCHAVNLVRLVLQMENIDHDKIIALIFFHEATHLSHSGWVCIAGLHIGDVLFNLSRAQSSAKVCVPREENRIEHSWNSPDQ